ncbi:hypothetical protein KM043_002607 [Ampulex compressa]|nr:hypothetical protein KM043_002607 [Ampulex compressa]
MEAHRFAIKEMKRCSSKARHRRAEWKFRFLGSECEAGILDYSLLPHHRGPGSLRLSRLSPAEKLCINFPLLWTDDRLPAEREFNSALDVTIIGGNVACTEMKGGLCEEEKSRIRNVLSRKFEYSLRERDMYRISVAEDIKSGY